MEKIWRLPLNRVYRWMGTWHCRRFPGTNSSKHEFSGRRTLQGTYFLRSNSPAYDPSSGHTLNQSIICPKPTKTFRRNPISGHQVYRKREMCNKMRQPPPQNIRRRYSRTPSTNLIHLPTKIFGRKPTPERPAVQKTRDMQQNASPTSSQHQTKRSSHPFHNPYSPSHQKHQMKVKSAFMTHSSSVEIARRATKYLQEIEMKKIERVNDLCKLCRNREMCNKSFRV